MPRPRKPHWHDRDRCYYTRIDGKQVALRHPDGTKVAPGDSAGIRAAVDRLLTEREERLRRASDPTVSDLCRDYLVAMADELATDTLYGKEWVLKQWCEFGNPPHGNRRARGIDSADLKHMAKAWEKDDYAPGMIRRLYREVKACWAWAARDEPGRAPRKLLQENPMADARSGMTNRYTPKYAPAGAIVALIRFAAARAETMTPVRRAFERQAVLMLRLIVETGCRPKEACEMRWEEFDADAEVIRLARHKTMRKTGRGRKIIVSPELAAELVALRDSGYRHPTHVFAHPRSRGERSVGATRDEGSPWGRPGYTAWFKRLVRAARKAKIDVPEEMTLYWLRASYLTDAIQLGIGGDAAADLAGNSREIVRQHYHAAQEDYLREQSAKVRQLRPRFSARRRIPRQARSLK
jgi:integrase